MRERKATWEGNENLTDNKDYWEIMVRKRLLSHY